MANLNLCGPCELSEEVIDLLVPQKAGGIYELGHVEDKVFYVEFFGHSVDDLNKQLKNWVGQFKKFKFNYANLPNDASDKGCENFYDYVGKN